MCDFYSSYEVLTERERYAFHHCVEGTFVAAAELDYLAARRLWLANHTNGFCWAASQAIEKLVKAIFLGNFKEAFFQHSYYQPVIEAAKEGLIKLPQLALDQEQIQFLRDLGYANGAINMSETFKEALKRFQSNGSPNNRYLEEDLNIKATDLLILDRIFFELSKAYQMAWREKGSDYLTLTDFPFYRKTSELEKNDDYSLLSCNFFANADRSTFRQAIENFHILRHRLTFSVLSRQEAAGNTRAIALLKSTTIKSKRIKSSK